MSLDQKIRQVKSILNREWNPIGLALLEDDDEYEQYARDIVSRNWNERDLQIYLTQAEAKNLGLPVNSERKNKIAEAARNIIASI